jgi:hypothetical protein
MTTDEQVAITLVCFGCRAERIMRIPRERGITPGKYSWECFACQEKRYGVLGRGQHGYHKAEQTGRGGNGRPMEEQEKT